MSIRIPLGALALALAAATPVTAESDPWQLPTAGACSPSGGLRGSDDDAAARFPYRSGDAVELAKLSTLRSFLPPELWEQRERFFFEGMRLEVGPCFADYAPPAFYAEAAQPAAVRLTDGGLEGYRAGAPFPARGLAADDPDVAAKWAWNAALRYQGAGPSGKFRIVDFQRGQDQTFTHEGEFFLFQLLHRADLADGKLPFADDALFAAGGRFLEPFPARHFAWRQLRPADALRNPDATDDLYAYLPEYRRVRRLPAARLESLYLPLYGVGGQIQQGLAVASGPSGGSGVSGAGGAGGGVSAGGGAASLGDPGPDVGGDVPTARSGFEGLALRPNLWRWRLVGVRDVLAPINLRSALYPADANRSFGPSGLSFANDRWDLRRALVLEARAKDAAAPDGEARVIWYFDLQTLTPLYTMSFDAQDRPMDVGVFAGRWSEEREGYRPWPGGDAKDKDVRVIDPVGAAFATSADTGWRRESWDVVSTPPSEGELRELISVSELTESH
jgi:hypothetical protein